MDGYWCQERGRKEWREVTEQKSRALGWMTDWRVQGDSDFWKGWMAAVSVDEVRWALKKGGRRKAPGLDGLPWEFWRRFSEEFVEHLATWCTSVLETGEWP